MGFSGFLFQENIAVDDKNGVNSCRKRSFNCFFIKICYNLNRIRQYYFSENKRS